MKTISMMLVVSIILISGCLTQDGGSTQPVEPNGEKSQVIGVYVNEDPQSLNRIHIADVAVSSEGELELTVVNESEEFASEIEELEEVLQEIAAKESLPLEYEDEPFVLKEKQVFPDEPEYIYAVQMELTIKYGFFSRVEDRMG